MRLWIALLLLASAPVCTRSAENQHLKIELLADSSAVIPGKPLWLGLHFEPEAGWHIYWINPGDSGEPPRVTWRLPAGFQAGPLEWPAPVRLGSGTVIDFGYDRPVLLPVEMRAPANLIPGSRVEISATVAWLVCREICVPGKTEAGIYLPVKRGAGATDPEEHKMFEAARSHVPKAAPAAWKVTAVSEKRQFVVTIGGAAAVTKASFFPLDAQEIDNAAPQTLSAFPGGVRLALEKSDQLLKTPAVLRGILETGSGQAYEVRVPVREARE